jgi:hypothetical protein
MKGFIAFFSVLMVFSAITVVQATVEVEEAKPAVSVSAEVGVASKYVGDKSGQVYENGPVAQSEIVISIPWFDISVWNNCSLERKAGKTDGDEVDYTISRSDYFSLGEMEIISLEYGVSYYDFSKLFLTETRTMQ